MTLAPQTIPTTTPPGPPRGPRAPVLLQTAAFGLRRQRLVPHLQRRYGDVFTLHLAPHRRTIVMLADPADIKQVFTGSSSVLHAGEGNAVLGPIMGAHSVLLLDETDHMRVRQLLMPAFHGQALRGYRDLVTDLTRRELDSWVPGRAFASKDRMSALTLEIILQVVFGVTDEARLARLRPIVARVLNVSTLVMISWFYPRLRGHWPWRAFAQISAQLDELLYAEIADRRTAPDLDRRRDVLSRLLAGSDGALSDEELRDNLVTLLLAGHETTATTLAWALHEIARSPAVHRRVTEAADGGDEDYLEAVTKESLRLRPVIYEVARRVTEPVDIGGYRVPRGATIMPAIGLVQSDDGIWPDPQRFDPDRFVGCTPAANTWIPFGGGVRRCLGAGFSLMEATVVLRELFTRFEVAPDRRRPEVQRSRNVTLAPHRGGRIVVTRR